MRLSRLAFGLSTALAMCVVGMATTTLSASSHGDADDRLYLALGDSVAFGYITQAGFEYGNPDNFVGYPEYIGHALRVTPVDASGPGETTGGFLSSTAADNGCRAYRGQAPLHVQYGTTQLAFATAFLRAHRETQLVTITLGANDLFLLQDSCAGDATCFAAGLPHVLAVITLNMETILSDLRATGFHGAIVVANYYSLDYADVTGTGISQALNEALAAAASAQGAVVADTFTAFRGATINPFALGKPCRAGLLNALPANQFLCDVHPSQSGQRLIAETVKHSLRVRNETN
jgi:lysophospholipase L1-like esterase